MDEIFLILSVLLYVFGIILLMVLIILGIRMFNILEKADRVLDNIDKKVNSLDSLFDVIDRATVGINSITEKVSISMFNMISRIFSRKKKNKEENYNE